jgi:hypothetical protein
MCDSGRVSVATSGRTCWLCLVQCGGFSSIGHARTRLVRSRKSFGPFLLALLLLSHLQYNPPGSVPIFFLYPVQLTFEVHHVSVSIIPPSVESKKSRIRLLHRGVETPV